MTQHRVREEAFAVTGRFNDIEKLLRQLIRRMDDFVAEEGTNRQECGERQIFNPLFCPIGGVAQVACAGILRYTDEPVKPDAPAAPVSTRDAIRNAYTPAGSDPNYSGWADRDVRPL